MTACLSCFCCCLPPIMILPLLLCCCFLSRTPFLLRDLECIFRVSSGRVCSHLPRGCIPLLWRQKGLLLKPCRLCLSLGPLCLMPSAGIQIRMNSQICPLKAGRRRCNRIHFHRLQGKLHRLESPERGLKGKLCRCLLPS